MTLDFVVLVKVVPRPEAMRVDGSGRAMLREANALVLNPFDRRAVALALDLRRPGEGVHVISMGPSFVEAPLRELFAIGVDSIDLVSDPALAESDTLVTARVLARAVVDWPHRLVLAGARTTDSETGQVGPEVASLLGMPFLGPARSVRRAPEGDELDVSVETRDGWVRYGTAQAVLLAVGERAARPRRPEASLLGIAPPASVRLRSASDLGLAPRELGLLGSPTRVVGVHVEVPTRRLRMFESGTMAHRFAEFLRSYQAYAASPALLPSSWADLPRALADPGEVLVLASSASGGLDLESLSIVSEVRRSLPGFWPSVLTIGAPVDREMREALRTAGAVRWYRISAEGRSEPALAAAGLEAVLERRPELAATLVVSDPFGRAAAGAFAARGGFGLVGDVVALRGGPDGRLVYEKPAFGGSSIADIHCQSRPSVATVRPGVFASGVGADAAGTDPWEDELPPLSPPDGPERLEAGTDPQYGEVPLSRAGIVIVLGTGIGGPDGIATMVEAFQKVPLAFGATRRVVDAGWMPSATQVGLTGISIAPRLAILVGVSGSPNHLIGLRRAGAILAINPDRTAPVFQSVDFGIAGAWPETLPHLRSVVAELIRDPTSA